MKNLLKIALTLLIGIVMSVGIFKPEMLMGTPASPAIGNWYQQFLPNLNGRTISDIFFLDSLTGWAVTPFVNQFDTTYVIKTTDSGNNWFIQFAGTAQFAGRKKIHFINANTGFTCGNDHYTGSGKITKTTNGGTNWFPINDPSTAVYDDMFILNNDTMWLVSSSSISGGVWRTTNGGINWDQQFTAIKPDKIYMYNARIGFITNSITGSPSIYKTTNSGVNWTNILPKFYLDIHFTDSLTGWLSMVESLEADSSVMKTTNGGFNWTRQRLPAGGIISLTQISKFSFINKDTIWGAGSGVVYPGNRYRGILYRTTNSGDNWLFQIPDTSFGIPVYATIQFINKNTGWAYGYYNNTGIHTTNGGDTNFLLGLHQVSNEVPKNFQLFQNYPNPFNPLTNIEFRISGIGLVTLKIYDITGREVITLIDEELRAGDYKTDWNASGYSSGIYFYQLTVNSGKEVFIETKKALLIK